MYVRELRISFVLDEHIELDANRSTLWFFLDEWVASLQQGSRSPSLGLMTSLVIIMTPAVQSLCLNSFVPGAQAIAAKSNVNV